ncbi:PLAT/LH2 domain-containing protein [Streptomyces sioyaensis]|uniref:PLAT/LH2 domain-containing protein n=1 Tax=Streptomyces sioyaensis TaxID=67364 RepID=UPI0037A05164
MSQYRVSVYTGDIDDAGTDANVSITIHGSSRSVGPVDLDNSENNFERGKVDHFTLDLSDVGRMDKINIAHDNSGNKPGWFLNRVVITKDGDTAEFPCSQWLANDETHNTEVDIDRA